MIKLRLGKRPKENPPINYQKKIATILNNSDGKDKKALEKDRQ